MAIRDGFIIPNANTYAPDFQTAQPDQGDFVILGNSRYGVISGCKVASVSGGSLGVSIGLNTVNVVSFDGAAIPVSSVASLTIDNATGSNPRFDLVVYNGDFAIIKGTESANPVFPDVTDNTVVLAALYVKTTGAFYVIDKRNFVQPAAISVDSTNDLATAYKSTGSGSAVKKKFSIAHDGTISWSDKDTTGSPDATISRTGVGEITVSTDLKATNISATGSLKLNTYDVVTSQHLKWSSDPSIYTSPVSGDIHVDTDTGIASIYQGSAWAQLSIQPPTGSVIMSFNTNMDGWLKLDGSVYAKADVQALYNMFSAWRVNTSTGTAFDINGNYLKLPDMRKRFPLGADANTNVATPSTVTATDGSTTLTLTTAQLPSHRHEDVSATSTGLNTVTNASLTTNNAGAHDHGSTTDTKSHTHNLTNSGIQHSHWSNNSAKPVVLSEYNASTGEGVLPEGYIPRYINGVTTSQDKIWVKSAENMTSPNSTGLSTTDQYTHSHAITNQADHFHTVNVPLAAHTHTVPTHSAVGSGSPITVTPPSLSIDFYIKK